MCSSPKLIQTKPGRSYSQAMSVEMDQTSYSRMIHQANDAYEKRHPEKLDEPVKLKAKEKLIAKPVSYWLTKASLTELAQLLARNITIS